MAGQGITVVVLGSAPDAARARAWGRLPFNACVAINNAWRVRPDWTHSIFPSDFPPEKQASPGPGQSLVSADDYVSVQNRFGGFVYAGGTMAFTAAYWVLGVLKPEAIYFLGCDMVYPRGQPTHFYGTGEPDPLRPDVTLKNLEAKSARFAALAGREGCSVFNLSEQVESRLVYPRADFEGVAAGREFIPLAFNPAAVEAALQREKELGYFVESGKYWKFFDDFDDGELERLDQLWLSCFNGS